MQFDKKAPTIVGALIKKWQRHTLPGITPVPSALVGLTALFGMGRGGPHRYSHLKSLMWFNIIRKKIPEIYLSRKNIIRNRKLTDN